MNTRNVFLVGLISLLFAGCGKQNNSTETVLSPAKETAADTTTSPTKEILLQQLKNTHTNKDWFVPANIALEGLTAEQAMWTMWRDKNDSHSIGQIAYHLAFWNERQLQEFKGEKTAEFGGDNEETFNSFTQADWDKTVAKLNTVLAGLEKEIEGASEEKLKKFYPTLANISVHNAYHTGQIVYIRKMKGWWNPDKGVK
jgi:DinB superfamily